MLSECVIPAPRSLPEPKPINELNPNSSLNKPRLRDNNARFSNYICSTQTQDRILEVNNNDAGIFFGYDPELLIKINDPIFYYKYSYRDNKFYVLKKHNNGALYEIEILDMSDIPLYDLL